MAWGDSLPYPYHSYRNIFQNLLGAKRPATDDFSVCPYFRMSVCPNTDFLVTIHKLYICMYMNIESTLGWPSVSIWIFYGISYFCSLSLNIPSTLNLIFLSIYLSICLSVCRLFSHLLWSFSFPPPSLFSEHVCSDKWFNIRQKAKIIEIQMTEDVPLGRW